MNNLDLIRKIFNLTLEDIANMLNVKKQSVSEWSKKNKIPHKRISELSKLLNIPEEYFKEKLTDADIARLQLLKIKSSYEKSEFEHDEEIYDEITGEYITTIKRISYDDILESELKYKELEIKQLQSLSKIERVYSKDISNSFIGETIYTDIFNRFVDIIEAQETNEYEQQNLTVIYYVLKALELTSSLENNYKHIGKEHPEDGRIRNDNKIVKEMVKIIEYIKKNDKQN